MLRLLFFASALLLAACEQTPRVQAGGEVLQGKYVEDGKVAAFLGIPFAEPPVGELRWRAPQPLAHIVAERKVTDFAPACMQSMRILDWYRWLAVKAGGSADYYADLDVSEDCLYLNAWTPTLDSDAKLPVMVWVHGGSNKSGWSYEPNYLGHELAQTDVVVVSVGYRQGVFGFLSHPELPPVEPVANFALWDLLAALQWIHANIEQFGGDPANVTMFGESAGAQNILALLATHKSVGLLHRGITQSTAGFGRTHMPTLADERSRAIGLAEALGVPPKNSLDALRAIPAAKLFAVYDREFADHYHAPALDGQLFDAPIWELLENDVLHGRELIIGSNDAEWYDSTAEDASWDDVAEYAASTYPDGEAALQVVRSESDPRRALDRLQTAADMLCPSLQVAATVSADGGAAWVYHFTRAPRGINGESLGAYHGAEYPYVFGTRDPYFAASDTDRTLQQAMQRYWVAFAATGSPGGDGVPDWPPYKAPDFPVQELGDSVLTKPAPEPELCALLDEQVAGPGND